MGKIKHVTALVIFSASILLIYANSLNSSWHLDDYQNILLDERINSIDGDMASLIEYVKSVQLTERNARPLSRFSFAVNWYLGRNDPFGYHLGNIFIHIFSSFFLYATIHSILHASITRFALSDRQIFAVSVLSTLLWAINPIQTQAITYIVQRMAALAAMFYILAMYLYIMARTSDNTGKRNLLFFSCFLSGVCAVASKENAATLPVALLLAEFLFFQDLDRQKIRNIFWGITIAAGFAMVGLVVGIFLKGDLEGFLGYKFRYFSPIERLLTEPRVVLHYLSQIFYPVPTRLSIEHDIVVSASLFDPWTTLPAMILVAGLIGMGLYMVKTRPVMAFAVLFFFLNHVIESSIIGLELVFEHRNYLPSFFLFVPVAIGLVKLLNAYRERNKLIYCITTAFITLVLVGFGWGTYIRNLAWQSEKSLWEDAVAKAPNSGRAWHNLALSHYMPAGRFDEALLLCRKALTLEKNNVSQASLIYSNMAASHYFQGNFKEAIQYWTRSLENRPHNPKVRYLLCLALIRKGDVEPARQNLEQLARSHPRKAEVLNLRGILALIEGQPDEGLAYFKRCFKLQNQLPAVLFNAGAAHSIRGDYRQAERFFKSYLARKPHDRSTVLWLIQNSLKNGESRQAGHYIGRLLQQTTRAELISWLERISHQPLLNDSMVAPDVDPRIRGLIAAKPVAVVPQ